MTVNGYKIGPRAELQGANLYQADLQWANLQRADLQRANLQGADLQRANLYRADLQWANLYQADLQWADLQGANLQESNLQRANLQESNLKGANLYRADLQGADLQGANLRGTDLRESNLQGAKLGNWHILPEGDLVGYKRVNGVLVTLLIPAVARRVHSPASRKCRAEWARVIAVDNPEGRVVGGYDPDFVYEVDQVVVPDKFDDDIRLVCTHGIHFYITREEC